MESVTFVSIPAADGAAQQASRRYATFRLLPAYL